MTVGRSYWIGAFLVAVALCALGGLAIVRAVATPQLRELQAQISKIRRSGEPIEPKDVAASCPIPHAEMERATEWMKLATLAEPTGKFTDDAKPLPFVGELEVKDDAFDGPMAHELREKGHAFLRKHQAPISLAHELARNPGPVAFPYRFEDGFDSKFPWVQALRALNRLLAMECRLRAVEGDVEGSQSSWHTMVALCESLRPRTCGVSCGVVEAVRQSMLRLAIEQVGFQINRHSLSDEQLRIIQTRLSDVRPEDDIRRVLLGERIIGLVAFQHPDQLFGSDTPIRTPQANLAVNAGDCLFFFSAIRDLFAASELPYPECRREAKKQLDAALQKARQTEVSDNSPFPGSAMMLPGAAVLSIEGAAPTIALRDIAIVSVACRRFSHAEGRLPTSLEELVPTYLVAVPSDPFTGDSLLTKLSQEGILVYSVGKNETDEGGENDFNNGDISWRVYLPRH
jgi:hypothetical protein